MLLKHKNKLFKTIENSDLDIGGFEFSNNKDDNLIYISFQPKGIPSGLEFCVRQNPDNFDEFDYRLVKYRPEMGYSEFLPEDQWTNIDGVIGALSEWLKRDVNDYYEETRETDLWEDHYFKSAIIDLNQINFEEQSNFTEKEIKAISKGLKEFKALLEKNVDTNQKQQDFINDRFTYLEEALLRLNKFDWKSVFASTIIGISTSLSFDTGKGQELVQMATKTFQGITHLIAAHMH